MMKAREPLPMEDAPVMLGNEGSRENVQQGTVSAVLE